jgi:serine/threonine protein kinase/tetratricopeptide (TPR) repeat protein
MSGVPHSSTSFSPSLTCVARRLAAEMAQQWEEGQRPLTEAILAAHPELADQVDVVVELVYEEICLRRQYGEPCNTVEVLNRFPRWREQLEILLGCHRLLEEELSDSAQQVSTFPAVGEKIGEFELLAELGSGSVGRVYLANQSILARRPVVLKLTPDTSLEYLSLARLTHTHIVPLYGMFEDPSRRLRILCMPYLGGSTLARILTLLESIPLSIRTGRHLLDALDRAQADLPVHTPRRGPARQFLAQASYTQAICWLGACLADALQYAHERGLIHLDIKPSNVLLAGDGQPMLLDFHLARPSLPAGAAAPDWLGGTPWYMSPEQVAALACVRTGQRLPSALDGRSDIYSLGLLLYEALGGKRGGNSKATTISISPTAEGSAFPPLDRCRRGFSPGLADIVARCLRPEAAHRYRDAADLAGDLRRHLAHLPLRGVPNRSWGERWRKWRQRRPHRLILLSVVGTLVLVGAAVGQLAWAHLRRQADEARTDLAEGKKHLARLEYEAARDRFRHGRSLLDTLPGWGDLKEQLSAQRQLVEQLQTAEELHRAVDRLRFLGGLEGVSEARLRTLEDLCGRLWNLRAALADRLPEEPINYRKRAREDLPDLAVLWTDLRLKIASKEERDAAAREALGVLEQAEKLFGPSPVLYAQRQDLEEILEHRERAAEAGRQAAALPLRTAWDHYALGRFQLRRGRLAEAAPLLDRAVELQPDSFWPHFYRSLCAQRQGRNLEAISSLTACLALSGDRAICYYNRALAWSALGRDDQAVADYTRAIEADATFGAAWLNRGVLHYRARRYVAARADLEEALRRDATPAVAAYNLALVDGAEGQQAQAILHLQEALRHDPGYQEARTLLMQLRRGN